MESIDASPRLTLNAASTRVAPSRAIEARWRRGRLNADSDILEWGISLNGDDNSG